MLLLLSMCLSLLPMGAIAYAEKATEKTEISADEEPSTEAGETTGTNADVNSADSVSCFGRVGNYTFFSDKTLVDMFGFSSEESLWDFLEEIHAVCWDFENIRHDKTTAIPEKEFYVEWNNINNDGTYRYPIKYDPDAAGKNGKPTVQDDRGSALQYMAGNHPLFSMDMVGYDVSRDDNNIITSIKFYCIGSYEVEDRIAVRQAIIKATEPVIRLFKGMRENNLLTDEQIVLLVQDYYSTCSFYDMARTGGLDAYGTLVTRKSVCQGQATALNYILTNIGIPCKMAANSKMGHGWNVVTIDGMDYNFCVTSAGTKRQGKLSHDYTLVSTEDYIVKRLGGKVEVATAGKTVEYVFDKYMDQMTGGPSVRSTEEPYWVDTATDDTYKSAFWKDVYSAFVLYGNDLIFISEDGKLCRWKGNDDVTVEEVVAGYESATTTEQVWEELSREIKIDSNGETRDSTIIEKNVLPGVWDQDGTDKFHTLITDYERHYDMDSEEFVEYKGKYYFSSDDALYELIFYPGQDGSLTYDYKEIGIKSEEILRDGEKIFDFYIQRDEIFFKIGTRYDTLDRDGRYAHYYIGEEEIVDIPMKYTMERADKIRHVFSVKKSDVAPYMKDEGSVVMKYMAPYNNPQSKSTEEKEYTRIMGEYIGEAKIEADDTYYRFIIEEHPYDSYYKDEAARKYASSPITVYLQMEGENNKKTRTQFIEYNGSDKYEIKTKLDVTISFDTGDAASVNYKVPADQLEKFASSQGTNYAKKLSRTYIRCEIPLCEETGKPGIKFVNVAGVKGDDGYYTYNLKDFAGIQMDAEIKATLFVVTDDKAEYYYNGVDAYIINENNREREEKITIGHTIALADSLAINYLIPRTDLEGYANAFISCEIPLYTGNEVVGSQFVVLSRSTKDKNYYRYSLDVLSALQIGEEVKATLFLVTEDGEVYRQAIVDKYSIRTYATRQLGKVVSSIELRRLCAELLRYGAKAQIFKGRNVDALVDRDMTEEQRALLKPLETVVFEDTNYTSDPIADPKVKWKGKILVLDSKVAVRFVFSTEYYDNNDSDGEDDDIDNLTLRVTYNGINGEEKSDTVLKCSRMEDLENCYSFDFTKLLSSEWRSEISVAVYYKDERVSEICHYSVGSYGKGLYNHAEYEDLLVLSQAMMAYSDTAKAFFLK